jgi:hypothetical protein
MNPTISDEVIAEAYERDPASAAAEYGAEFRSDQQAFVTRAVIEAAVSVGVFERPPVPGVRYVAFADPSGGSSDAMTLAIAHDEDGIATLDLVRETQPPFSPNAVVAEFASALRRYYLHEVEGDRYAGEWPAERFKAHGIAYRPAEHTKSEIYLTLLPLLNSRQVDLLDINRLTTQLSRLERRVARGGRDSIDHPRGAHDDSINAAAGALVRAASRKGSMLKLSAEVMAVVHREAARGAMLRARGLDPRRASGQGARFGFRNRG